MTQTFTRRGSYSDFTVNVDQKPLRRALRELQNKGEGQLDGFMRAGITAMTEEVRHELKSKAGALANVRVPPTLGYGKSTNIHVKVANALKVHRYKEMEYAVHTGKSIQDAAVGVLGQRGGRLAHIVAKGIDPFRYGNLPMLVMSSTRWYKSTGARNWVSTGMRMRASHPGFYDTMDYIGEIEKKFKKYFEEKVDVGAIIPAAILAGFSLSQATGMSAGGSSATTKTGGTGIMAARRG
jgi:hypothetical protein